MKYFDKKQWDNEEFGCLKVLRYNKRLSDKYNRCILEVECQKCKAVFSLQLSRLKEFKESGKDKCVHCNDVKIGDKFDYYKVIGKNIEKSKEKGHSYFYCRCICGNVRSVEKSDLQKHKSTNCGCIARLNKKDLEDITNHEFTNWTAESLNVEESERLHQTMWNCRCKCGNTGIVSISALKNGKSKSCGCYVSEAAKARAEQRELEKPYHRELRDVWISMIDRCKEKRSNVNNYYNNGITVCPEWSNEETGFDKFYEDMVSTYTPGLTLDRKNTYEGYCKENCRWISLREQQHNKSTTRYVEYYGMFVPLAEICDKFYNPNNIDAHRLYARLNAGFSVDEALQIPVGIKSRELFYEQNPEFRIIQKPFIFVNDIQQKNLIGETSIPYMDGFEAVQNVLDKFECKDNNNIFRNK